MIKLIKNKKAAVGYFYANWPEMFTFVFLIIGFILAATAGSRIMTDIIIFFCGAIGGRLWHQRINDLKVPLTLILIGFLVGFVIGSFRYGYLIDIVVLYLCGIVVSFQLHKNVSVKKI